MKYLLHLLPPIFFFLGIHSSFAQETETVYTMSDAEKIANNENELDVYQSKDGYMVVVEGDNKRTYIINKKEYGPFNRNKIESPTMNAYHWGFADATSDNNVVVFDGVREDFPKTTFPLDLRVAKNLKAYVLYDETNANYKLSVNGKKFGPYSNIVDYYLSPEGTSWAVQYYELLGRTYNFYIEFNNGKKLGPYSKIHKFALMNEDAWIVIADKVDIPNKNIAGKSVEQMTMLTDRGSLGLFEKELVGKNYEPYNHLSYTKLNYGMNVVRNQQIFYMVNGYMYGPYDDFVAQSDLGIKPKRFNYVVGKNRTLYFRGEKKFMDNVRMFTVSDSRNSVAIVKDSPAITKDTLIINNKYFVGSYEGITDIKYVPKTENFYFWTNSGGGSYTLHTYVGSSATKQKSYAISPKDGRLPKVSFSPNMKHWGFVYGSAEAQKVVIDNKEYATGFINKVEFYEEKGQQVAFWLSLEGKKIIENKVRF